MKKRYNIGRCYSHHSHSPGDWVIVDTDKIATPPYAYHLSGFAVNEKDKQAAQWYADRLNERAALLEIAEAILEQCEPVQAGDMLHRLDYETYENLHSLIDAINQPQEPFPI